MRFSVTLILDIPYSKFSRKAVRIAADGPCGLVTEAIPKRALKEVEKLRETLWKEVGWKHVNMKFCFRGVQIEFVFDQEKQNVVAVYISSLKTGKVLACSSPALVDCDEDGLKREVAARAAEAGLPDICA